MLLIKASTGDKMADMFIKALLIPAFELCLEGVMRFAIALRDLEPPKGARTTSRWQPWREMILTT